MAVSVSCMEKMLPVSLFLFFYMVVYSLHSRVVPQLIETRICQQQYNQTGCDNLRHQKNNQSFALIFDLRKEAISWQWKMMLTSAVPSIITVFFFGLMIGLSNNIRRIILLCTVILGLQCLIYLLVGLFKVAPIYCLLIGNCLTILYGGFHGARLLTYVYVALSTKPDGYRTIKFAILEGTSYCAIALGRFGADYIVREFDYKGAFGFTLAISVGNFIFMLLLFPLTTGTDAIESYASLANATESEDNTDGANHIDDTASKASLCDKMKSVLCSECLYGSMEYLAAIMLSNFLFAVGRGGEHELMPNVVNWQNVGLSLAGTERYLLLLRLAQGLASVPIVVLLTKACCMATDVMVLFTALSSYALALVLIGFAQSTTILFIVSVFAVCEPLAFATFRAVATKEVQPKAYGAVIGVLSSLNLGAMILMKFIGFTYKGKVHQQYKYQYVAFLVLAIVVLMAFIIVGMASLRYQKSLFEFEREDTEKPKGELKPLLKTS